MNLEPKHLILLGIVLAALLVGVAIEAKDRHATRVEDLGEKVINRLPDFSNCRRCPEYQELIQESLPYIDIPMEFRVNNYAGGSCVFASMATLLHHQGEHEMANWLTASYRGGEYSSRLHRRLDAANLRYAFIMDGDLAWLEKCCRLRLGAIVNWPSNHMVTCVGVDDKNVYLIDNNSTSRITVRSRAEFQRAWTGWATTLVYCPPAPEPKPLTR